MSTQPTKRAGQPGGKAQRAAKVQLVAWPTILFFVGLATVFFAERVLTSDTSQRIVDLLGVAIMIGMVMTLLGRRGSAQDSDERLSYTWMVASAVLVLCGAGLYLLFGAKAPAVAEGLRNAFGKNYESAKDLVTVLWPTLCLAGGLPLAFIQRSLATMTDGAGYAETVELVRVRHSAQSALTISLVVVFCASVNYVASDRNKKWDLARFRSTRPSETTKKIVQNLSKPLKATLFFANPNEVRELVMPYFEDLQGSGGRMTVEVLDHAMEPTRARDLGASGNGVVVLSAIDEKGNSTQRETINIGQTLEASQTALSSFDGDVQKKLLQLSRPGRIAYFTTGHGERGFDSGGFFDMQKDDLRAPVGFLRTLLQNQGYEVKTLSVGQGLSNKVPADAGLVIMAGPNEHVLPEEVTALSNYLNDGGHLYVLLDPAGTTANGDLAPLLKLVGVKYTGTLLANDEVYAVRTQKPADKANIVSTSFSSHVSVTTLSRASGRAGVILPRSGYFERDGAAPAGVQLDFTLRSMPKTYADRNLNFTREGDEPMQVFDLAAVANKTIGEANASVPGKGKRELRLALVASVDAVADLALQNRANAVLALDTIKWLMQEEAIVGETVQETDAPIFHTKDQDKIWFYSTILAAPALILALGHLIVRRGRQKQGSQKRRAS